MPCPRRAWPATRRGRGPVRAAPSKAPPSLWRWVNATCTITNDDQAAHLKLVKSVVNDNGGTAQATDFTLSAAGPTPISGAGVAEGDVNAGSYALSETSVAGYTAGAWSCEGGSLEGATSPWRWVKTRRARSPTTTRRRLPRRPLHPRLLHPRPLLLLRLLPLPQFSCRHRPLQCPWSRRRSSRLSSCQHPSSRSR